jgi:alpha-L-fucosidase
MKPPSSAPRAGLPNGHFYGPTTLVERLNVTLYLFIPAKTSGPVMIKGLKNKINSVQVVGTNTSVPHKVVGKISWSPVPGLVYIDVPAAVQDDYMTVLSVQLDAPIQLYRGHGGLQ